MSDRQFFRRPGSWLVVGGLALYLLFSLLYLDLPGLQHDEVNFVNGALGNIDGTFVTWYVDKGPIGIPVMIMRYYGAVKSYLYAPILAIFGSSVWTLRLPVVLFGLATLILTYKYSKAMLGLGAAQLTLLFLATDASFIFANRLDWGPVSLMMLFKSLALYLLWRWLQEGRISQLAMGSFILGLALFEKIIFAWFIVALVLASLLCFWPQIKQRLSKRVAIISFACFLAGCAPLITYNLRYPLMTFRDQKGFTDSWREALRYRYQLVRDTLDGSVLLPFFNDHPLDTEIEKSLRQPSGGIIDAAVTRILQIIRYRGSLTPTVFILALVLVLFQLLRGRLPDPRTTVFFILLWLCISVFICITADATAAQHVIAFYPFHLIIIAVALGELWRLAKSLPWEIGRKISCLAVGLGAASMVLSSIVIDLGCTKSLGATGGGGRWSDAIYRLGAFVRNNPQQRFMLMDWGFSTQLLVLRDSDKINYREIYPAILGGATEAARIEAICPYLINPVNWFVFHYDRFKTYPTLDDFKRALAFYGLEKQMVRSFSQRNGEPIYLVCGIVRPELDAFLRMGNYFYFRENEDYDQISAGTNLQEETASQLHSLDLPWKSDRSDYVAYQWRTENRIADVFLTLRVASGNNQVRHQISVEVDGTRRAVLNLDGEAGDVSGIPQWKLARCHLGSMDRGTHELAFRPLGSAQPVRMDFFYLTSGVFDLPLPKPASSPPKSDGKENLDFEIQGFEDRPEVRLEVHSPTLLAGSSTLSFRIVNLQARAIDLLYTYNGKSMPIIRNWKLDEGGRASVPVDITTPKGIYVFNAIRKADTNSPTAWIQVDTPIFVK